MKILLLNAFHAGSHKAWAESFQARSRHEVELWTLRGKYWKWRMHGAALSFSRRFEGKARPDIDLVLCTDMLELNAFKGLAAQYLPNAKYAMYFHENQVIYPWKTSAESATAQRDMQYGFMNLLSATTADAIFFNSQFHRDAFIEELGPFLKAYPDERNLQVIDEIAAKSNVLYLGNDLQFFNSFETAKGEKPIFVWNHRHEHDKNPEPFFESLISLSKAGHEFGLIVLGEYYANSPDIFQIAKEELAKHIIHWGYAENREHYAELLWCGTHLLVTSIHDFFGQSVVEAAYCNCLPILPRRLVYPEHFNKDQAVFYDEDDEIVSLLQQNMDERGEQGEALFRYDWSQLIDDYDDAFESLVLQ